MSLVHFRLAVLFLFVSMATAGENPDRANIELTGDLEIQTGIFRIEELDIEDDWGGLSRLASAKLTVPVGVKHTLVVGVGYGSLSLGKNVRISDMVEPDFKATVIKLKLGFRYYF